MIRFTRRYVVTTPLLLGQYLNFLQYLRMLRLGVPLEAVKNAMIRAGQDPNVLCQDPRERLDVHVNTVDWCVESQQRYNKVCACVRESLSIMSGSHSAT